MGHSSPTTAEASAPEVQSPTDTSQTGLRRSMEARHLVMIAMGGVIGSGLFVSSGYTIATAGKLPRPRHHRRGQPAAGRSG